MIPLGKYRHYKGKDYEVIGIAKLEATQEPLVIYKALYDTMQLWARPLHIFTESVVVDGQQQPRYRKVEG